MTSAYDEENVFAKILAGRIPADVRHEDDRCLVFRDVSPKAPHHLLVIPKQKIAKLGDATEADRELLGHLLWVAGEVARQEGFADDGYRVVINHGARANQSVFHLHVHVLAGRDFTWPPG